MKWTKRSIAELSAILVMTAVVVVLAVLEYRWTKEISGVEQNRLKTSLATSVLNFDQEFSYDFEQLCEAFEVNPEPPASAVEPRILSQYFNWSITSSHPGLIAGLYVWKQQDDHAPLLEVFDREAKRFQQTDWPIQLGSLRGFIAQRKKQLPPTMLDREAVYYPWTFYENYEETPALVRPLFQISSEESETDASVQPIGFLIVELSDEFLKREYFPELVDAHFGRVGFEVAVRSAQPPYDAIYLSDAAFPISTSSPDATLDLFESVSNEARRRGHAPVQPSNMARQWQLVAQHPSGSLELAVGALRRRNLAISLGLLSVLAGSMILVVLVARRAERLAKLQIEFVAGVSHELCTPLAVINSTVENLADGVVDTPARMKEYAVIVRDQSRRLERLLDQVLLFAAGRFDKSEYTLRPVDLGAIVEQSLTVSEPMFRDEEFTVEKDISSQLPLVNADSAAVTKCLENLLSNAMKYGEKNHWLAVRVRAAQTNSQPEVEITVEDKGIGISGADMRNIFEPFYRVQSVREGQKRGVGLGLHLVKRMMEGMGGRVSVSSELGRGTCFVLHFAAMNTMKN